MSFIQVGNDEERYRELEAQLNSLVRSSGVDPVQIDQLKKKVNKERAKHGLVTYAQLKPLKPLKNPFDPPMVPNSRFEKDPFQLKDPTTNSKPMTPNDTAKVCPFCECKLSNTFMDGDKCPNCNTTITQTKDCGVPSHAADPPNPNKGRRPTFIPKNVPINVAYNLKDARSKKDKDHAKHDEETVRDTYLSDPFDQCSVNMEGRNPRRNDDYKKEDVMRSCLDLAIDG